MSRIAYRRSFPLPPLAALLLALLVPGRAGAQLPSVDVNSAAVQFNLSNPGARSLARGGAFASSADDATAAYANPAGIVRLSVPEVSIEVRGWSFSNFYTDSGRRDGPPKGVGVDRMPGVVEGVSHERALGLSFFSFVYPINKSWAVAAYHHELANFRSSMQTQGAFFQDEFGSDHRLPPSLGDLTLRIASFGSTISYSLNDNFSAGLNVARYSLDLASQTSRFDVIADKSGLPGTLYGPPDYSEKNRINTQTQDGSDSSWAWNTGILWRPKEWINLGAIYRRGSAFNVDLGRIDGPKGPQPGIAGPPLQSKFHVPTVYGAGVTFDTMRFGLRVSVEADRVLYSSLTHDIVTVETNHYRAPNITELHIGVEQDVKLPKNQVITLRVGGWRDPDHRIHYGDPTRQEALLFRPGPPDRHLSAGFGLAMGGKSQVDVAFDHSRREQVASVSVVTRLPQLARRRKQ